MNNLHEDLTYILTLIVNGKNKFEQKDIDYYGATKNIKISFKNIVKRLLDGEYITENNNVYSPTKKGIDYIENINDAHSLKKLNIKVSWAIALAIPGALDGIISVLKFISHIICNCIHT